MKTMNQQLYELGLIPVIKITDPAKAVPLARALCNGGLPAAEITFRTACAAEAIAAITGEFPDMLVGAGTVLNAEQADRAVAAGAKFIVSPGLNPNTVRHCQKIGVPILPGCANPSDIEAAIELGLDTVKFFPAEAAGGIAMIKAMSAPYGNIKFMPTGGINAENLLDYLAFDKIIACGGSFMVKEDLIEAGDFDAIEKLTRNAVMKMLGFDLKHVGINCADEDECRGTVAAFENAFGFEADEHKGAIFAGTQFEVLKGAGRGTKGHLAISTNFVDRAEAYLTRMGYEFIDETRGFDAKGKQTVVYLKNEIGGFAVHLVKK
ncbi:MAG: bifunctional 4-hydroxy-2-oxoglutarate aldolase/2-dehydro-3-deoxy-phosphogluconate aldolase [Ruminococcaceae bacterium]|nr:bifunctional 4-hydroxy-2-oxoglutarate aldolase/2-dehydro-3-deoxy-phosphogluconate aldolase [Oscillospiraceae bacterium]